MRITLRVIGFETFAFAAIIFLTSAPISPLCAFDCPTVIGQAAYGRAYGVGFVGSYALVGSGPAVRVVEIEDPTTPQLVHEVVFPGIVLAVEISGDLGYIAAGEGGLRIIDVADPASPIEVGHAETQFNYHDVAVIDNYAYMVDPYGGLGVVDIRSPEEPFEVGFITTVGDSTNIAAAGDVALVSDTLAGLLVVRNCSAVFVDGFETGTTSAWTSFVP